MLGQNLTTSSFNPQLQSEIWRDVPGCLGLYQVSSHGRVRRVLRVYPGKIMKPWKDAEGYLSIRLSAGNKTKFYFIHRLVAETFISNPNEYAYVNHLDKFRANNIVENLEWCSNSQNVLHGRAYRKKRKILTRVPEAWKDVADFENCYQISTHGNIKSLDRYRKCSQLLKQKTDKGGYLRVNLCVNGIKKTWLVHRLVALAFLKNQRSDVNHKDGDRSNNKLSNLEWCSKKENAQDAHSKRRDKMRLGKITKDQVINLLNDFGEKISVAELAVKYGLSISQVCNIVSKKIMEAYFSSCFESLC